MAAPVFNTDASVVSGGDTTSLSIGAATTSTAGAPIYVALYLRGAVTSESQVTPHTGFSHVATFGSGGANQPVVILYVKTSSGSESGTYDFTLSSSDFSYIQSWWVSGVDESDPLPAAHQGSNNSGTNAVTTIDAPSVTTGRDECRVLRIAFYRETGSNPTFGLTTFEAIGTRGVSEQETQATAGATGTATAPSSTSGRAVSVTLAFQPSEEAETGPWLLPEILTPLPLDPEEQDTADQDGEIIIQPPVGEGTLGTQESTLILITSRSPIPHANMTTSPGTSVHLGEGGDLTDASRPWATLYRMPPGHIQSGNYVFENSHAVSSGQKTIGVAIRVKDLHPTDPVSGIEVHFQGGDEGGDDDLGDPDGIVRFDPLTPDHVPTLILNLGATRRTGLWTKDAELNVIFRDPDQLEDSDHAAYFETHDEAAAPETPTEAPQREAFHDNPLDPFDTPPAYYRRVGVRIALRGAQDDELPGMPDHAGTEAVSWESVKLVATDVPGSVATDDIKAYRHTATMAGAPASNGTLIHTFSPDGSVVHATGWDPDETYFIQYVATNANGSTLGPEFQVTTWPQAAYVLTDAQTMEIPMEVVEEDVTIRDSEFHGSNLNDLSWNYEHPGGSLLVFVAASDADEVAVVTSLTIDGGDPITPDATRESAVSSGTGGGYILGGVFFVSDVAAGTLTLAVQITGGTISDVRWQVDSIGGPSLSVRDVAFTVGVFETSGVQRDILNAEGDLIRDFIAWRNSAINVATIGGDQTQHLADDSPTRMNGTTRPGEGSTAALSGLTHTATADSPSNVCIYGAVSIRPASGGGTMRSLRVDVGKAALNDSDLSTTPSLLVEVFDESAVKVGEDTLDGLSLVEGGIQEIIETSDIAAPQTAEIHLTNTGRTVAVWRLLGREEAFVPPVPRPVLQSALVTTNGATIRAQFDKDMADPSGEHGAFSFDEDGTGRTFSAAALDGSDPTIIVLTVNGAAIAHTVPVTLSYTPGTVEAADGGVLKAFTDEEVDNLVFTPPVVTSAFTSLDGTTITFVHDKAMSDPTGEHGAYSFRVDAGSARGFTAAALGADPTEIVLTVDGAAITFGTTVDGSYTPGTVESTEGVALEAFTNQAVTNGVQSPPDTPTITAGTPGATTCPLTSSAFSDPNDDAHAASHWQVTTAADTGFASPVFDSGEDVTNLEAITANGLETETDYICRVRHKDDSGDGATEWSEWSATDAFTTAAEPVNWQTGIYPDLLTPVIIGDPDDPAERAEAGLLATDRVTRVRVNVEDADGTMQDVGDLANEDLLDGLTIEASTDQLISRATLSLWRAVGAKSLAPLMEGSVINRDSGGNYAPLINPNRAITVEVATLEQGTALVETDWALIFDGLVDEVDWGQEVITVHARDKTAQLNDTLISTVSTYGDDGGSKNIDDVMQDILDAEFGAGVWPLAVIGSPTLPIAEYELGNVSVHEALRALADLIGWNIHYRWNRAAQAFRLTLWEPDRANITPFWTFGPDDYYVVSSVALGLEGIRNVGEVIYTDVNGDQQTVSDTRPISVAIYGERFIRLDAQGSSIVTETQANNLLKAMLDDLEDPKVSQVIEAAFFWPLDLGDVHEYTANGVHYDTNQTWACFAYTHEIKPDRVRSSIAAAGKPSGGFRRWHGKESASDRRRQIEDAAPLAPWVQADFERNAQSETATLTLTVRDPQGSIDAVEYSLREGSQAGDVFSAYSSAWDVSPTSPPYDGTYSVSVSVPGGEESAVRWRVSFTDAAGTSRTIGSTHSTSQIDEHEVERLYMVAAGKASLVGRFDIDSAGAAHPETADGQTAIWVPVLLPEGVEVTGIAIRAFQNDSAGGDVAGAAFRRMGDGSTTLLGNANGFADGWNTYSNASLAEVVSAVDSYMFQVTLQNFAAGGSATDARARWVSVTYIKHTQLEGV